MPLNPYGVCIRVAWAALVPSPAARPAASLPAAMVCNLAGCSQRAHLVYRKGVPKSSQVMWADYRLAGRHHGSSVCPFEGRPFQDATGVAADAYPEASGVAVEDERILTP